MNVKKDAFYVQGHFPGNPVMPGVLIVEAFGQASAALTAHGIDKKEDIKFTAILLIKIIVNLVSVLNFAIFRQ